MNHQNKIIEMYENAFEKYGDSPNAVLWPKGRQQLRFDQLMQFASLNNKFSILDYGCGLAHLYEYLLDKNADCYYTGIDFVDGFVTANREKHPDANFYRALQDVSQGAKFDYVIVSGAFNIKYYDDYELNRAHVYEMIERLFKSCNVFLAINFMTDRVDYISDGAFHLNHYEFCQFVEENLSKRFALNMSYMPYEYTVVIWQDSSIRAIENVYG